MRSEEGDEEKSPFQAFDDFHVHFIRNTETVVVSFHVSAVRWQFQHPHSFIWNVNENENENRAHTHTQPQFNLAPLSALYLHKIQLTAHKQDKMTSE